MKDIDELIMGYLAFELSDAEKERLREWLSESEEHRHYFRAMESAWYGVVANTKAPFDKQIAYKRFLSRIHVDKEKMSVSRTQKLLRFSYKYKYWAAVAAVLVGLVWGGLSLFYSSPADYYELSVPLGSQSQATLPDGSLVWLNAGTSFEYRYDRRLKKRCVKIDGEGYFEVAKNKDVPFIVETGQVNVRVLGTKFNVDSYKEDEKTSVTLLEGSVALHREGRAEPTAILVPNEMAVFDKVSQKMTLSVIDPAQALLWKQGIIGFENESLGQIARDLSRKYDVKIDIIDDALKRKRFYGTFGKDETVYGILDKISAGGSIGYRVEGDSIVIYSD